MKKLFALALFAAAASSCNNAGKPIVENSASSVPTANEKPQTAIAHSLENQTPGNTSGKSHWTQSGDAIDTKKYDAVIDAAEKTVAKSPSDPKAKKLAAEAYLDRANALTKARQYASALGDYRRVVKYDPSNDEAKNWIEQITGIYESMNRQAPKEGEEPPPLPYKGETNEK
jgi:tetratricopeptide (TPR) repeat protein